MLTAASIVTIFAFIHANWQMNFWKTTFLSKKNQWRVNKQRLVQHLCQNTIERVNAEQIDDPEYFYTCTCNCGNMGYFFLSFESYQSHDSFTWVTWRSRAQSHSIATTNSSLQIYLRLSQFPFVPVAVYHWIWYFVINIFLWIQVCGLMTNQNLSLGEFIHFMWMVRRSSSSLYASLEV